MARRRFQSGAMHKLVKLEQKSATATDKYGAPTHTWAAFPTGSDGKHWAHVEPLTGTERVLAQQADPTVTHKVTMRHLSGTSGAMRVIHDSRTLQVESVLNLDEEGKAMQLMCREDA